VVFCFAAIAASSFLFPKWTHHGTDEGVVRDAEKLGEQQWYTSKNIEVSEGTLKLIAKRGPPTERTYALDGVEKKRTFRYYSGEVNTHQYFDHGMIEIRCRIPSGKGSWPAFWLWGNVPDGVGSEIDVFEYWNRKSFMGYYRPRKSTRIQGTNLHWPSGVNHCPDPQRGVDAAKEFHTFRITWDNLSLTWETDGRVIRQVHHYYSKSGVSVQRVIKGETYIGNGVYPHGSMWLFLNLAIQSGKNAPRAKDAFPYIYEIDYVKVWQRKRPLGTLRQ
jgi:beta-glucanase (GH16 family)